MSDALRCGRFLVESPPTYVQGYNLLLTAELWKRGTFRLSLHATAGDVDWTLEWPFVKRVTLSVIHLNDPSKTISSTTDLNLAPSISRNALPRTSRYALPLFQLQTYLKEIEKRNLVTDDTVHLYVEINP